MSVKMGPSSRENIDEVWRSHSGDYEDTVFYDMTPCFLLDVAKNVPDYTAMYLRIEGCSQTDPVYKVWS
jgi:hypothetical protein